MSDVTLTEEQRDALVSLVVRGMARGEASAVQQSLADAGLILVKGPVLMPTPAGTELVGGLLRLPDDAPERERIMATFHRFLPVNRQLRDLTATRDSLERLRTAGHAVLDEHGTQASDSLLTLAHHLGRFPEDPHA